MRILIDLQGAQATHYGRGIGRYALSLALAIIRQRGTHDIRLLLNGHYPQTIDEIRHAVGRQLPPEHLHVWQAVEPFVADTPEDTARRDLAQHIRNALIASIRPDVVLITSLFEGPANAAAVTIDPLGPPAAVVLYDLIPWIHRDTYLTTAAAQSWYQDRLSELRKAQTLLAISESSRQEAIAHLSWSAQGVVNISTACDDIFAPAEVPASMRQHWANQYRLQRPFLMYTGGIDRRKNIERLIRAYALLPQPMRSDHQLVIVCAIAPPDRQRLQQEAEQAGLRDDDLIMTGYVPEDELIALYNACKAFVFPSWHEGFGLPALEAMRCGKAVIASSTTSLPEVIGCPQALFDPYDEQDIRDRIQWVLGNDAARQQLQQHGLQQSRQFNWDHTARAAIEALEQCGRSPSTAASATLAAKPRLACISPLPPEQSGISDYTAQLLRALSSHYQIDVIVAQQHIADPWILEHCPVRTVHWFMDNHRQFDRVLYHFGNSHFHDHMLPLLERIPGVVVLHDFFLSGLQSHHLLANDPVGWQRMLHAQHGYPALLADQLPAERSQLIWHYPCNLQVLQQATGIIVHSHYSRRLACQWYGPQSDEDWQVIPLLREPPQSQATDRQQVRQALGLPAHAHLVCSFGLIGEHKLSIELLEAFLTSGLARNPHCMLIFVGANHNGPYGQRLLQRMAQSGLGDRIRITGWTDAEQYRQYLHAADVGVQLRTKSRGETSAAVLDCMSHGLPTIVNANGSMADLHPETVWMLPDPFHPHELCFALESLFQQPSHRQRIGQAASRWLRAHHAPQACAGQYRDAIQHFHRQAQTGRPGLIERLHQHPPASAQSQPIAAALSTTFAPRPRLRQLLVDISELVRHDARTGIQRVTRAILNEWLRLELPGWRIEPVWANQEQPGYHYARQYTSHLLNLATDWAQDTPVQAWAGDVFVGLDLQPAIVPAQRQTLRQWRRCGVSVQFVVYDLLPVQFPQYFVPNAAQGFTPWLQTIAEFDAVHCISRATRDALSHWLHSTAQPRRPDLHWFHLGADVEQTLPTLGLSEPIRQLLGDLQQSPAFLMVGTLEPRKGHAQVLDAFEQLWQQGHDLQLIVVGKQGWQVDALAQRLTTHPEHARRLHWLQNVSDEALGHLYRSASALIAASHAEGYGLPLIEAARHGCPVIARDIPVFREVAESHAHYFSGQTGADLSNAIEQWLELQSEGKAPLPQGMHLLTWRQSARQLLHNACHPRGGTHPRDPSLQP